ncbi:hypothetical protein HMPREF1863_01102 [Aedoeadaptatus coxii]|uniref:Uncharacterized protein n=1 Tax=Aedoeadaptatus coxii TaxID=755172 RepID=A0A134AF43_9FIRM|nr:hypothetical protein HMPREF1863_01102 [Peptoniphilus coxii]
MNLPAHAGVILPCFIEPFTVFKPTRTRGGDPVRSVHHAGEY